MINAFKYSAILLWGIGYSTSRRGDSHTKVKKHRRYGESLTTEQIERILKNVHVYEMTHAAAGRSVGTSWSNVTMIINEFKAAGNPYLKPKTKTIAKIIDNDGNTFIENFIKEFNSTTLKQIKQAYQEEFDVSVSESTLHHHLPPARCIVEPCGRTLLWYLTTMPPLVYWIKQKTSRLSNEWRRLLAK